MVWCGTSIVRSLEVVRNGTWYGTWNGRDGTEWCMVWYDMLYMQYYSTVHDMNESDVEWCGINVRKDSICLLWTVCKWYMIWDAVIHQIWNTIVQYLVESGFKRSNQIKF